MSEIQAMKDRCIEAVETFRRMNRLGGRVGPSTKSGYWPDIVREIKKGDRAPEVTRVFVFPTAVDIQRAEEFLGWINTYLTEDERNHVHNWAYLKTSANATIRGWCEKMGLLEHNYRRRINAIFQKLAFTVSHNAGVMCSLVVDDDEEIEENRASSGRPARVKGLEVYRPEEARPEHLPDSAQHKRLISDLLKRQKLRTGSQTRAA